MDIMGASGWKKHIPGVQQSAEVACKLWCEFCKFFFLISHTVCVWAAELIHWNFNMAVSRNTKERQTGQLFDKGAKRRSKLSPRHGSEYRNWLHPTTDVCLQRKQRTMVSQRLVLICILMDSGSRRVLSHAFWLDFLGMEAFRTIRNPSKTCVVSSFPKLTDLCAFAEAAGTERDRPHAAGDEQNF